MIQVRLLPLVIVAASTLLALRGLALISDGRLDVFGSGSAIAQQAAPAANAPVQQAPSTAQTPTAPENGETLQALVPATSSEAMTTANAGSKIPEFSPQELQALMQSGLSESEIQLLLRLRERREDLNARERQLELRENMLKSLEGNLQGKIKRLEKTPGFSGLDEDGNPKDPGAKIKQLVTVYEAMKPKDAARILSRLDTAVLTRIAKAMKPRKMSAIMAQLDPEAAEKLTLSLVDGDFSSDLNTLPQIGTGQ